MILPSAYGLHFTDLCLYNLNIFLRIIFVSYSQLGFVFPIGPKQFLKSSFFTRLTKLLFVFALRKGLYVVCRPDSSAIFFFEIALDFPISLSAMLMYILHPIERPPVSLAPPFGSILSLLSSTLTLASVFLEYLARDSLYHVRSSLTLVIVAENSSSICSSADCLRYPLRTPTTSCLFDWINLSEPGALALHGGNVSFFKMRFPSEASANSQRYRPDSFSRGSASPLCIIHFLFFIVPVQ